MATQRISHPTDLELDAITNTMAGLASDLYGGVWWQPKPILLLSARGSHHQIEHHLEVLQGDEGRVMTRLHSLLPNLRFYDGDDDQSFEPLLAVELMVSNPRRPLRMDQVAAASAAVLGALSTAGSSEILELRWLISGGRHPRPVPTLSPSYTPNLLDRLRHGGHIPLESESRQQQRLKQSQPWLLAIGRIGVTTGNKQRARQLISRVLRALSTINAPGVALRVRSLPQVWAKHRFMTNKTAIGSWSIFNASELVSLVGWPVDGPQIPGLSLGATRQLAPAQLLSRNPTDGVVIGDSTFPGLKRPVVLRRPDTFLHDFVVGPTGSGKSVLLNHVAEAAINSGDGLVVIDPKGDLVDPLVDRVPELRRDDVIVFDPADADAVVGLNPLHVRHKSQRHLVVDQLDTIFHRLWGSNYGPRSGDVNRAALHTLLAASSEQGTTYTLAEVPLLLTNQAFRRRLVEKVEDPTLQEFWAWFESLGTAQTATISPLLNKYRAFLVRPPLKHVLAQAEPSWSVDEVLAQGKILLVRLAPGEIGEESASLLGALVIARVWQAALSRTGIAPEQRRPAQLIVDEVARFMHLPTPLGEMLALARSLKLGITMATQFLGQLDKNMQAEVLANARSLIAFQTTARDAPQLAQALPGIEPEDLKHLGQYEVLARLAHGGSSSSPPTTLKTRPPSDSLDSASEVRARSQARYAVSVDSITAEIQQRREDVAPMTVDDGMTLIGEPLDETEGAA